LIHLGLAPHCPSCPLKSRCTKAKVRSSSVGDHDSELVAALNLRRLLNLALEGSEGTWVLNTT
jgi:hypothetical protein